MRSFSLNKITQEYASRVLEAMERNKGYIIFFNKGNFKEAYQRIFMAAMREEKSEYPNLDPYIKVLARNVMKSHSRDISYAPYNEEGEVAVVFTSLVENQEYDLGDKEAVIEALKEIYLAHPEDFMQLAQLIPSIETGDIKQPIRNKELQKAITQLTYDYTPVAVFYGIVDFVSALAKEKAKYINKNTPSSREVQLLPYTSNSLYKLGDKPWILDNHGIPVGIDKTTLYMEDDFNPEFHPFTLAVKTVCTIWKVDISDYLSDIETKVYLEQGVDNEYILWCGDKYRLTTPAGEHFIGISREAYMEQVRKELISSFLEAELGTLIAVGPETLYIKLTKATNLANLHLKVGKNKTVILPVEVMTKVACGL